jgi:head-tail adaptor
MKDFDVKNIPIAARLNKRIEIFENINANDLDEFWSLKLILFADVRELLPDNISFFEGVDFGNLINQVYMLFTIRFNKNISKDQRIEFKEKKFLIKKIINVAQKDRIMEIIAMQVT